jgi:hypothetical protein
MSATTIPEGCDWVGPSDARTLNHIMDCPVCSELWPQIARQMRIAKGRAVPSDDPAWLGANVGYKDK